MPRDTVNARRRGAPMAKTSSPGPRAAASPNVGDGRPGDATGHRHTVGERHAGRLHLFDDVKRRQKISRRGIDEDAGAVHAALFDRRGQADGSIDAVGPASLRAPVRQREERDAKEHGEHDGNTGARVHGR
jgi:hypothetical protein